MLVIFSTDPLYEYKDVHQTFATDYSYFNAPEELSSKHNGTNMNKAIKTNKQGLLTMIAK